MTTEMHKPRLTGEPVLPLSADTSSVWAEFAAPIRAFVARRAPRGIDPDDVVQEVFLRVVLHLPSLRDAERIESWLFQIARNALRDAMRARRRRDSRTESMDLDSFADADVEDAGQNEAELAPCLTPLVAKLPEPYRTAIELTSQQNLTQVEAAKLAGVSVSGMKSRVQRAREQLKQLLLRCCSLEIARNGGVSDYHVRDAAACGSADPAQPASSNRCCPPGPCSSQMAAWKKEQSDGGR
jgi:RNA polymerase sigma-70 factor, ECF subfamily